MEKSTKIIIGSVVALVLAGGTFLVLKKMKKKKTSASSTNTTPSTSSTPKQTISSAAKYTGINATQTKKLQQKLNYLWKNAKLGRIMALDGTWRQLPMGDIFNPFDALNILDKSAKALVATGGNMPPVTNTYFATFSSVMQKYADPNTGLLKEDGIYGDDTIACVKALQQYLNETKNSKLTVDGKYGSNTDKATGWKICS